MNATQKTQRDTSETPSPWRVEGPRPERAARSRPPWRRGSFWLVVLALLVINNVVGLALAPGPERTKVTYTFFRQQVNAGNVGEVEARNDTIQGNLRKPARYSPPSGSAREVDRLATALLEHETLDEVGAYRVAGIDRVSDLSASTRKGGAGAVTGAAEPAYAVVSRELER